MNDQNGFAEISAFLDSRNEWLIVHSSTGNSFALKRDEIEINFERNKILFAFLDDKGFQIWRVANYKIEKETLILDLTRNFEREREKIRLVPRVSATDLSEAVVIARLEKANRIARLIIAENPQSKLIRVALNEENGRFARIVFENEIKKQIAALADVSDLGIPETLLTSSILWLTELQSRQKNRIETIWILAEEKLYKNLRKLHALLDEKWKSRITIGEISREGAETQSERIAFKRNLEIEDLWREKPPKISVIKNAETSRATSEIIKLAPEKIDVIFTRHGETLRFLGLPFARVRRIGEEEKVWFGIEKERHILNENSRDDFFDLLKNLDAYRRFDSTNKRHSFFRLAPEAWLEAILRRNVKLLDGNLILSPVYNQFRAGADKIDLLALRRDGRLIVIELKVAPDREMIFQAIDYWRKVELQRRSGNLQKAKIFGDSEISDKSALVYLVAPTLSFHPNFNFLSKTVSPEIEIYKFYLNENWREELKVMNVSKLRSEK